MRFPGLKPCLLLALLAPLGCRSAMVDTTVHNATPNTIDLIEVDYPSASFGVQALAPNADFHYRFKIIGAGPLALTYTDTSHTEHKASGPTLREGDGGRLTISIGPSGVQWTPILHNAAASAPPSS